MQASCLESSSPLTPYHLHQNESLLIQFILSELFTSYKSTQQIKEEKDRDNLLCLSDNLITETINHPILYQEGSLIKLSHYCNAFLNGFQKHKKVLGDFSLHIHNALHKTFLMRDLILKEQGSWSKSEEKKFTSYSSKLSEHVHEASQLIIKLLPKYTKDENLLFFLLRHYQEVEELIHPLKISDFFKNMSYQNHEELREFLISSYSKRGFYDLHTAIDKAFALIRPLA